MELDYTEKAKNVMRELMELGNFDEFRDHREPDGLNDEAAAVIAKHLGGAALEERMRCNGKL